MKRNIVLGLICLFSLLGCKKKQDPPPQPTTGIVSGTITNSSGASVSGAEVIVFNANTNAPTGNTVTTDVSGKYSIVLNPGSYYVKINSMGYQSIPPAGMSAIPFSITAGNTTTSNYELFTSPVTNGGIISGKVTSGSNGVAGVLVVAHAGTTGYSSITDGNGNYNIYNVPAGTYSVRGFYSSYNSDSTNASVTSGAKTANVNVNLSSGASGSVTGSVTFLSVANQEVDVALVNPYTKETIPGLSTITSGQTYTINNVPEGYYFAKASFRNDSIVMDPDWLLKNGQPTALVNTGTVTRNFSVTGAISLVGPTNSSNTTTPKTISTTTPAFSWSTYPSTSDYVIEVSDANGNVIWGGFSGSGTGITKNVSIPSSQTSVVYNYDGTAKESLVAGHVYRWRIYASKNVNSGTPSWKLISVSEDQKGLIQP